MATREPKTVPFYWFTGGRVGIDNNIKDFSRKTSASQMSRLFIETLNRFGRKVNTVFQNYK
jgi:hypothetical protein